MSTENRQLFGGPHDGTRVFVDGERLSVDTSDAGFMQALDWNVVPVLRIELHAPAFDFNERVMVYGAFDGPHLYMEDSEGRLSHVPPAMNGALRMPATLQ
jgi:hypothetical protein